MFSIIIVSFNARAVLQSCLKSIQIHEPEAQVIVVDNDSRDGSYEMVSREFPWVTLLQMGKNAGFAAANNAGLAMATKPFVVLLNSDTELSDDSLSRCVRRLQKDRTLGAVHPRLTGPDGKPQLCEHSAPSLADVARKAVRMQPLDQGVRWLAGTALVIRKTALDNVGHGLDDNYFMYWEDADLSARLQAAGWKLDVEPLADIKHLGGASGGGPDASRRADLYAWYLWGKHRWFRRNRPFWEATALWMFDAFDVARKFARGIRHSSRRKGEWSHARVTASVLCLILLQRHPRKPAVRTGGS
ncbi:MAG: glycosyltransferase family 2 protein [Gemmataceae bacterium]